MQITRVEVTPVELKLQNMIHTVCISGLDAVTVIFIRLITQQGQSAWGCTVAHPDLTGDTPEAVMRVCQSCADRLPDLHPTHLEYTLAELAPLTREAPSALVAFDLALHDLLGWMAGMPLYRLLGGYRNEIPTSVTIPCASIKETLEVAEKRAEEGFRIFKLKGGFDPEEDVAKIKAVHRAYPHHTLRLDVDGGYEVRDALEVARALEGSVEMLEQPTPPQNLDDLGQVTNTSRVPVLADQSVTTPESAIEIAARKLADGFTIKVANCGGVRPAMQFDAIARAAKLMTMVSCVFEPRLLIAAGLAVSLSSPNVHYTDLDGYIDLVDDPSQGGFELRDGNLTVAEVPGLGCRVDLA